MSTMTSPLDSLLSLIAPHSCLGCRSEGSLLCYNCVLNLPPSVLESSSSPHLVHVTAATPYGGVAKQLIRRLKFGGAQAAVRPMAAAMSQTLTDEAMLIVPVPTASSRVRRRGYDQAVLLARALARRQKQPYVACLRRIGQAHQVGANRQQRLAQLSDAFYVARPERIRGKHVLLVDDVITTGATFESAAKALYGAGATRVSAVAFAQA